MPGNARNRPSKTFMMLTEFSKEVKRSSKDAGLPPIFSPHSFRVLVVKNRGRC